MRLPYSVIEKLNNLTNCEMTLYLWLCERQNNRGVVYGVRMADLKNHMSKQSFYNALNGLQSKQLIYTLYHKSEHDYDIGLFMKHDYEECKQGYINLNNQIFQSDDFKKLNSREKYLMISLYAKTSVNISSSGTKAIHRKNKNEFYKKYTTILNRSKRRIREYLHDLRKFFNINIHKEMYYIGRNRNTYSLDKKEDKNGKLKHRIHNVKAMTKRYGIKGATDKFIEDVVKLYKNYIKMFDEFKLDRAIAKAIEAHSKDNNKTASAARVHQYLRKELAL